MKISEMITDRYKLRIPPTVYYELLADVQEAEEEQELTTKNNLAVDCISRQALLNATVKKSSIWNHITNSEGDNFEAIVSKLPSVTPQHSSGLDKNSKKLEKDFGESDCISREAVFETIDDCNSDGLKGIFCSYDDGERFKKYIKNLPPITPQPRKGHWDIKDKMWWVCSACGCQTRMMKKYNVPNFCPACGADMRESEEE